MEGHGTQDGEENNWVGTFHPSGAFLVENKTCLATTKNGWTAQADAAAWVQDASNLIESLQLDDHEALVIEMLVCTSFLLLPEAETHIKVLAAYALSDGASGSGENETCSPEQPQVSSIGSTISSAGHDVPLHQATAPKVHKDGQLPTEITVDHVIHFPGQSAAVPEASDSGELGCQSQSYGHPSGLTELEEICPDGERTDNVHGGIRPRRETRQQHGSASLPQLQLGSKGQTCSSKGGMHLEAHLKYHRLCTVSSTVEIVVSLCGGRCLATIVVNPKTWRPQALLQRRYGAIESWEYAAWRKWNGFYWFPARMQHRVRGEVVSEVFVQSAQSLTSVGTPIESPFRRPPRSMWPDGEFSMQPD
jgi:hypothetical protein